MRLIRRFLHADAAEKLALSRAAVAMVLIRVSLSICPFRVVHRVVRRLAASPARPTVVSVQAVTWSVLTVARRVPGSNCLTQALAAWFLLSRAGHPSTMQIGVVKDRDELKAHAWVESEGLTIFGASKEVFEPLPLLWPRRQS